MSGSTGRDSNPSTRPRAAARARLRQKAQLTLPEEIRAALRVTEGDELEFSVGEDGVVRVRGYVSIPADQVWLYSGQTAVEPESNDGLTVGPGTDLVDSAATHPEAPADS